MKKIKVVLHIMGFNLFMG